MSALPLAEHESAPHEAPQKPPTCLDPADQFVHPEDHHPIAFAALLFGMPGSVVLAILTCYMAMFGTVGGNPFWMWMAGGTLFTVFFGVLITAWTAQYALAER